MNAHVLDQRSVAGMPSPRQLLGAYLEEIRCEALRLLRNPGLAFPVLVMPVALYALIALVVAGDATADDPLVGVFMFSAFSVMAISMPALFGIGTSLAMEREMGMLRLRRAQPAPGGSWLVAKIACGIAFGLLAYLPILATALAADRLPLDAMRIVAMSAALIASAVPFCAMGLMIGTLFRGSSAPGYANLVYLPGCYLSGMFFPLPASMHWQTPVWPQFHVNQLAMHAAGVGKFQFESLPMAAAGAVGFTVLFSAVAIWRLARKG
ncbi:ABC transporter permease [Luteimonas viscosa]|uniref:ABC transporter permease n=1 Tax=Luteimonas viscosa TaxID=1132694 RepID=A0A5D4XGE6_9GAMM|nr:ABC transporter permease [Luteimonas viscosa]TYT23687.1 ABC transporter permease [Luteimonas viscosa]